MGLEKVYTESKYLKAGMIATDLIHENEIQADFFEPFESSKKNSVPSVIDRGECQVWQEVIRMVVEGYEKMEHATGIFKSLLYYQEGGVILKSM